MPVITASGLTRIIAGRKVLSDLNFSIEPAERIGLIGSNGSGKSTLVRLLAGHDLPDEGSISRRRGLSVAVLEQTPDVPADRSALAWVESGLGSWHQALIAHNEISARLSTGLDGPEAIALVEQQATLAAEIEHFGGWDPSHKARAMLEHLGISAVDQLLGSMSGGEQRRVALARVLVSAPDVAVLDEPTNHLDAETIEWLEGYLIEEFKGSLLVVTHDRYFLDRVVERVFELDRGKLSSFEGNYARYLELRTEREAYEARVEANRMNILRRERDWLSRTPAARTTKQKARIDRAHALEQTVRDAKRTYQQARIEISSASGSQRLLELRKVTQRIGERILFRDLDLMVAPGERIGIVGRNGSGKSTLLRTILGEMPPAAGELVRAERTRVAYYDQQRTGVDLDLSVLENIAERGDKIRVGEIWYDVHTWLSRFLFEGPVLQQKASSLSGGELARLGFARMLRGDCNLLVLDEPTNDLDLVTLSVLEEALASFEGSVLIVTHDRFLLDRVATRLLMFEDNGTVVPYAGGWNDAVTQRAIARAEKAEQAEALRKAEKAEKAQRETPEGKPRSKLSSKERTELEALPQRIDDLDKAIATAETALGDPGLYVKGGLEVRSAQQRVDQLKADLSRLMTRWEELESRGAR